MPKTEPLNRQTHALLNWLEFEAQGQVERVLDSKPIRQLHARKFVRLKAWDKGHVVVQITQRGRSWLGSNPFQVNAMPARPPTTVGELMKHAQSMTQAKIAPTGDLNTRDVPNKVGLRAMLAAFSEDGITAWSHSNESSALLELEKQGFVSGVVVNPAYDKVLFTMTPKGKAAKAELLRRNKAQTERAARGGRCGCGARADGPRCSGCEAYAEHLY